MSKLFLLYATFLVTLLFLVVPDNDVTIGYPFSDMRVSLEFYIYSLAEKLGILIFIYIIAKESTAYREAIWIFLWLSVLDLVDFLLNYSEVWFYLDGFPVSMNVVKCVIFGIVILNEIWKKSYR